jgi:glycosyltransferase involved in cell wall biosynthesis
MARGSVVLFQWGVSSYFGWGIYGLNMMLSWAARTDLLPVTLAPIDRSRIDVDRLESARLEPGLRRSAEWQDRLKGAAGQTVPTSELMLEIVQNGLIPGKAAYGTTMQGSPSIGVAFLERTQFPPDASERLRRYPLIVAGSTWNRELLQEVGAPSVALVLQGVDPSHFHPAPRRGLFKDRFVVFSGGKLEFRKGQDLVLRAFRIFALRHQEAMLLTAWGSPLPHFARSITDPGLVGPRVGANGQVDVAGWTLANGIAEDQVLHCGAMPNRAVARIMREADVALFPNRAEGGTNLVAMECMACGVPVILSANTGHLDLLNDSAAIGLWRQKPIAGDDHRGWGASEVDEIVAALESVHANPFAARALGQKGAAFMQNLTWAGQLDRLAELVKPYAQHGPIQGATAGMGGFGDLEKP